MNQWSSQQTSNYDRDKLHGFTPINTVIWATKGHREIINSN